MKRNRMKYRGNELFHNNGSTKHFIVKDEIHPDMYRIKFPDGELSDMANFTRTRYKLKGYLADEFNCGLEGSTEPVDAFK